MLAKLRQDQNDVIHLTDAERALFVDAVAPVIEEQRRIFGDQLFRSIES